MKTKVKRKLTIMERRKSETHMNPHNILVGFSGKVGRDNRLEPLRMTRKYKSLLLQEESDRNEKVQQMSTLMQKYKDLVSLISSLRKGNRHNANSSLIVELEEEMKKCKKHLLYVESKIDCLPDGLNKSMKEIFNQTNSKTKHYTCTHNSLKRKKAALPETTCPNKKHVSFEPDKIKKSSSSKMVDENFDVNNRSSWYGSVKSQIFVRDGCSQLRTINIDLFSNGENLLQVLASELGGDVNSYSVTFGTKKIDRKKTLWEQEIYHGTTVDLNIGLHGGRGKKKASKKGKTKVENKDGETDTSVGSVPENPELWTKDQVAQWITEVCKNCEIDEKEVSNLMSLNGYALSMLHDKDDWLRRSPTQGDILYTMWNKKKKADSHEFEKETVHVDEERPALVEPEGKEATVAEDSHNVCVESVPVEPERKDESATRGPFGNVENLTDLEDSISVYRLAADTQVPEPKVGSVISVSGICREKPRCRGAVGTILLRDDPPGAVCIFNQIKVDVRGSPENKDLHPKAVETLLKKITSGVPVAVRGRVEPLDDGYVSNDRTYETLSFKLVVDSDCHALVYVENNPRRFVRQSSQPWYAHQGVFASVVDGKSLNVGDNITKTPTRVFCKPTISDNEIEQYVVAFKNSSDGDIFIGVEQDGKVVGMEFTTERLAHWRENISKVIGGILPAWNEEVAIFYDTEKAIENIGKKCFVSVMKLGESTTSEDVETIRVIAWIHVTKGKERVYFSKGTEIQVFVRVGAETKQFSDYKDLFNRLDSLATRPVMPTIDTELECKKALGQMKGGKKLKIFGTMKCESHEREFKMIFGAKPVGVIEKKYLSKYACGFLNSSGGTTFFGVQEDEKSKVGYVAGIVVPQKGREELVRRSVAILSKFYPPVNTSQFCVKFYDVSVSGELILKYHKTRVANSGKCVLLRGPEKAGNKWLNFFKSKFPDTHCRVIQITESSQRHKLQSHSDSQCFCTVVDVEDSSSEQLMELIELFVKENSTSVTLDGMDVNELIPFLKNLCIVELQVNRSRYPVHMIKPIETFVFDEHGELMSLSQEKLMQRFGLATRSEFDVKKFLDHVENFDSSGISHVLVASPFNLPKSERDLYGLVIPKWTLTIDLDQHLKREGHLYKIFEDLNDLHQTERNRFIRTPKDQKLDLNPNHGICWLAARGYEEIATSLSEDVYVKWNTTHRPSLRSLLQAEVTEYVKPNRLNIVVLWEGNNQSLLYSLRMILEDIVSINGERTALTFVCSTPETKEVISSELVQPLQKHYWEIVEEDRVYVAPPFVLAQFLSSKLPDPYRPEDHYQVPHKKYSQGFRHGNSQTFPKTLPQYLRRNIHGHLEMMYITKERKFSEAVLNDERFQFYSGSEITPRGLQSSIGIKRTKMAALEKEFKTLSNDRKSHVSLIIVKSDRGAGSTTMCLQFLFQHRTEYPCAQLTEIKDCLVDHIHEINRVTELPLLLLVDEEIANLQNFLDFKKEAERRNVNVILLLIEPAEAICKKTPSTPRKSNKAPLKSARDSSLYGTSPYRVVELRRELDEEEMGKLTDELISVTLEESKRAKLLKLKDKAKHQKTLKTFAHFSLTAFGHNFKGLKQYVEFRLSLANKEQKAVLAFLSLTHVYTDYSLPVNALAGFLGKNKVSLEVEFEHKYLRELLSPPADGNDSRRISFIEVAQEILNQLAAETSDSNEQNYWQYIKNVSIQMAKDVLSINILTKKIDRLARKLFVTSEYETEKFSLLVRSMKEDNPKTARDTLVDLVKVFEEHTSFRAHLLAHLAKYHMTVDENFEEAKPRIEEAIKDQRDDTLLHHIHGDIIRLQVQCLKNKRHVDMNTIVSHAHESSNCFDFVRSRRPNMSHGYISDAMVRITVMRAAIKVIGKESASFVDYLIGMIDDIKERDCEISMNERYLLTLIPDAHQYLDEGVIDFEHREKWKENFLDCIGKLTNLETLCKKLKDESGSFSTSCSRWLNEISLETQVLYNALEIETNDLTPEEIEKRINKIEECDLSSKLGERTMKFWIRYSRQRKSVPSLKDVSKRVKEWVAKAKKNGGISPYAEFYNYVVNVLIALKDPKDREKMNKASKLMKRQQSKKYNKKGDAVLPLEWLHCKQSHHINSIDSLLHHDDLMKETSRSDDFGKRRPGREAIEGSLFEKQVTKWQGTVKEIKNGWQGTIAFKGYLEVHFIPLNMLQSMPDTGETVQFCLSFDKFGLSAWAVARAAGNNQPKYLAEIISGDEDSSSGEETDNETVAPPPLYATDFQPEEDKGWDSYNDQHMQGVVMSINIEKGFGWLRHPDVLGELFFHAQQLVKPVKSFQGTIMKYMVLDFKVKKIPGRTRATDIHVLEPEDYPQNLKEYLAVVREEQNSSPSISRREKEPSVLAKNADSPHSREEGVVLRLCGDESFGFIKADNTSYRKDIFFHRNNLVNKGSALTVGDRVLFRVTDTDKGHEAKDIFVQSQYSAGKWEYFIGRGIQEGFVVSTTEIGGMIKSHKVTDQRKNLPFRYNDIENAGFPVMKGSKVHFEVQRRGGKCVAGKISIINPPEGMIHAQNLAFQARNQGGFFPRFPSVCPNSPVLYTGSFDPFLHQMVHMDQMDEPM